MTKNEPQRDEVFWALIAYVLHIFGAAFVLFTQKDKEFASYHARQSLMLAIVWIISGVVVSVLLLIPFFWRLEYLLIVLHVFFFLLMVVGIFNALFGRKKPLPLFGKIAEEIKL